MNEHTDPDLEQTIARSLDHRSRHLGAPTAHIDDVFARVDRRRARKRSVAVAGSFAVVGAGLIGIVTLNGDPVDRSAAQPPVASAVDDEALADMAAWRCRDQLEYWGEQGDEVYYVTCEQVAVPGDVPILDNPPATAPTTTTSIVPMGSSPVMSDEIDCTGGAPISNVPAEGSSPIEQRYFVVPGDSIASIGERYQVDPAVLANYNSWPDCLDHLLLPGDVVLIPPNTALVDILSTTTVP